MKTMKQQQNKGNSTALAQVMSNLSLKRTLPIYATNGYHIYVGLDCMQCMNEYARRKI